MIEKWPENINKQLTEKKTWQQRVTERFVSWQMMVFLGKYANYVVG